MSRQADGLDVLVDGLGVVVGLATLWGLLLVNHGHDAAAYAAFMTALAGLGLMALLVVGLVVVLLVKSVMALVLRWQVARRKEQLGT